MKSVSSLRGVYNTIMPNLEEKTRKIEDLECQMIKVSDVKPEATSHIVKIRLYSEAVSGNQQKRAEQKTFRLTVKSKSGHSIKHMKTLVKTKVNAVDMKIGITTFKGPRNGQLLTEIHNKQEIDALSQTFIHSFIHSLHIPYIHIQVKYQGCGNCQSSCINIC